MSKVFNNCRFKKYLVWHYFCDVALVSITYIPLSLSLQVLSVQVHGDAAFAAQGVVMETFAMANIAHYEVGGSLHLVVNNYLGFTTPAEHARYIRQQKDSTSAC